MKNDKRLAGFIFLIGTVSAFAGFIIPRKPGPARIFARFRAAAKGKPFIGTVSTCPFCTAWWSAVLLTVLLRFYPRLSVLFVPAASAGIAYALLAMCGVVDLNNDPDDL